MGRDGFCFVDAVPVTSETGEHDGGLEKRSSRGGSRAGVRILSDPGEVEEARHRAQEFERLSAAHQAERAEQHRSALARTARATDIGRGQTPS